MRYKGSQGLEFDWAEHKDWPQVSVPNKNLLVKSNTNWPELEIEKMLKRDSTGDWFMGTVHDWLHNVENRKRRYGEHKVITHYVFHIRDEHLATMARLIAA